MPAARYATFDAHYGAVAPVRHYVTDLLRGWNLAPFVDNAELVASELAANAVRATWEIIPAPINPKLQVRVSTDYNSVILEVADLSKQAPRILLPTEDMENGRGLMLVTLVAKRWSYYYANKHKVVWAEIGL